MPIIQFHGMVKIFYRNISEYGKNAYHAIFIVFFWSMK